jgi:hypothetical protein
VLFLRVIKARKKIAIGPENAIEKIIINSNLKKYLNFLLNFLEKLK